MASVDFLLRDGGCNRSVAATQAFPCRHDVGNHPPVIHGKGDAGASESGHDLISNQDDIVAIADVPDGRVVVGRRRHPRRRRSQHGLGNESRDVFAFPLVESRAPVRWHRPVGIRDRSYRRDIYSNRAAGYVGNPEDRGRSHDAKMSVPTWIEHRSYFRANFAIAR